MSIKNKAIISVLVIIISLFLFSLYHVTLLHKAGIENQIQAQRKGVEDIVATAEQYAFAPYYARIKGIWKTNPQILEAFALRDREALLVQTLPKFQVLKQENPYFQKMHFHLPDGHSFLRVHSPDEYGDDLSQSRPAVQKVHRTQRPLSAFEAGVHGGYYRIIEPVFAEGRYLGALEFGIDADLLIDALAKHLTAPVAAFYKKAIWEQVKKDEGEVIASGPNVIVPTGNALIQGVAAQVDCSRASQRVIFADRTYDVQVYPLLKDSLGEPVGGVVVLLDITEALSHQKNFIVQVSLFSFGLVCIAFVLLYFSFGKLVGRIERESAEKDALLSELQRKVKVRAEAQSQLAASHLRFTTVMENLDAAVFVIDFASHEVLFANSYVQQLFGETMGKPCWQVLVPDQEEPCSFCPGPELVDPQGNPSEVRVWEYYHPQLDRWFELHEQAIHWVDNRLVHLKIATDITFRKKIEEDLVRHQARVDRAQSIAHLGYWDWDNVQAVLSLSEETCRILGRDEKPCSSHGLEMFLGCVHPEDRGQVEDAFAKVFAESIPFKLEHRIVREDGVERIVHHEAEILAGEEGAPTQVLGVILDITAVRETSKQLMLSANVFENSIEGIVITDPEANIQLVNRAFSDITGFGEKEALGQNPRILKSDHHDQAFYGKMWEAIVTKGHWQGEIWNRRKTGEIYPQWTTISSIVGPYGKVTNYVGIFHDMSEIKQREEQLLYQAQHDALTGLPNRVLFKDRLGVAMAHAKRRENKIGVLFLDLDNFKNINDSLGHTVGDSLLVQVAKRLLSAVREDDTVARYGGDEFIIMLDSLVHEEEAVGCAQRIIAAIRDPFAVDGSDLYVTFSIGIAFYPADGLDQESVIKNADLAMYRAKDLGRNTYQLFTEDMDRRVVKRLSLENNLRRGVENEEFIPYYQPKVDMQTGAIVGAEALVRWHQTDGTLVSPDEFIPIAEETGLIVDIGASLLRQVCRQVKSWQVAGHFLPVAVNLSPRQFVQHDLIEMIRATMAEEGISAQGLEFEVTESLLMDTGATLLEKLWALREMGVRLAIDDFGTGYSSLSYLKKLPIETIKIDRSFVRDIPHDKEDVAITTAIISMAKSLNLKLVAEGIETPEQLKFLRDKGCEQAQGFLFSKPIPGEEFMRLLGAGTVYDVMRQG